MNKKEKHSFVICAYNESPYLEECIRSLMNQTEKSNILLATSTPNEFIRRVADKYHIKVFVNEGQKGLAGDWNFGLQISDTQLVTLAHQDDIYMPTYVEEILNAYQRSDMPIILFTDYYELRKGVTVQSNRLLKMKRYLLTPLKWDKLWNSRLVRRRILSLGSAICCPSVTFVSEKIPSNLFKNNMKSNIDWQAWEELSRREGAFVYINKALVKHRIHEKSTTSELLAKSARRQEDIYVFQRFWPKPIAKFIEFFYQINEKSNRLD